METNVIPRSCDAGFPSVMKSEAWSVSVDAVHDASACSYHFENSPVCCYLSFLFYSFLEFPPMLPPSSAFDPLRVIVLQLEG